jgi:hypothetical protein
LRCFAEASSSRDVSRFGFPTEGLPPKSRLRVCLAVLNVGELPRFYNQLQAGQLEDLTDVAETCAHYFVFVTELFVLHNLPALIQRAHIIARHCFRARAWLHGE